MMLIKWRPWFPVSLKFQPIIVSFLNLSKYQVGNSADGADLTRVVLRCEAALMEICEMWESDLRKDLLVWKGSFVYCIVSLEIARLFLTMA